MDQDTFGLSWKSFQSHLKTTFLHLQQTKNFSDVTLVTQEQVQIKAHKFVLSACSPVLQSLFLKNPHPNTLIYLHGVKKEELECLLEFMYFGETRIDQDSIDEFLKVANNFKVKELEQDHAIINDDEHASFEDAAIDMKLDWKFNDDVCENEDEMFDAKINSEEIDFQQSLSKYGQNCTDSEQQTIIDSDEKQLDIDIIPEQFSFEDTVIDMKHDEKSKDDVYEDEMFNAPTNPEDIDFQQSLNGNLIEGCQNNITYSEQHTIINIKEKQIDDSEKSKFYCKSCPFESTWRETLVRHKQTIHEGLMYRCDLCSYQARWRQSIRDHIRSNHPETVFAENSESKKSLKCDQCEHVASKAGNLKRHIETQHNKNMKYYNCDFCPYKGKEKGRLKKHQESRKCLRLPGYQKNH